MLKSSFTIQLNPFVPNAPFLYPLKTSENLTVFLCFQELQKECIGDKCVNPFQPCVAFRIETSYLIFTENPMTGFYSTALKWVNHFNTKDA